MPWEYIVKSGYKMPWNLCPFFIATVIFERFINRLNKVHNYQAYFKPFLIPPEVCIFILFVGRIHAI
jgi:hypothetical protein